MAQIPNLAHQVPPPPDPDGDFHKFFARLQRVQKYKEIVQVSRPKDVHRMETGMRLCWDLCYADRERLQKRMDELNLNFFKQLAGLKVQLATSEGRSAGAPAVELPDIIEFYEPMQYFSDDVREIVLAIIEDRIRELLTGMKQDDGIDWEAKCAELEKRVQSAERRAIAAMQESQQELLLAREREAAAKAAMEEALEQLAPLKEQVETLSAKIPELEAVIEQQREEIRQVQLAAMAAMENVQRLEAEKLDLEGEINRLGDKITELEEEIVNKEAEKRALETQLRVVTEKISQLEKSLEEAESKLAEGDEERERLLQEVERIQAEVNKCLKCIAELEEAARQFEAKIKVAQAEITRLEKQVKEIEDVVARERARAEEAEAKAAELQAELDRRNNTKTRISQTTLTGERIDETEQQIEQLNATIRDWEQKYTQLVERLEEQGLGEQVEQLSKQLGFQKLYKVRGIFERLYEDSFKKAERMDRLRTDFLERSRHAEGKRFALENSKMEAEAAIDFDRLINEKSTSDLSLASMRTSPKRQVNKDSLPLLHSSPSSKQTTWRIVDPTASPSLLRSVPVPLPSAPDPSLVRTAPPSGMDVPWVLHPSWQQQSGSARVGGGKTYSVRVEAAPKADGFAKSARPAGTRSNTSYSYSDAKATQVELPKLH